MLYRTTRSIVASLLLAGCAPDPGIGPDAQIGDDARIAGDARVDDDAGSAVSFSRDVAPLLARECTRCHDTSFRGDFRTADGAYAALSDETRVVGLVCNAGETERLRVVVPGSPETSGLWRLVGVGYHGCGTIYGMPKFDPRGILRDFDPAGAETIRRWIAQGALRD